MELVSINLKKREVIKMSLKKRSVSLLFVFLLLGAIATGCSNGQNESVDSEPASNADVEAEDQSNGEGGNIVVLGDTINSHLVEDAVCVVNSRFEQGWRMVFRANVLDLDSDEMVEDADVKVVLETGEEFEMELGPHGTDETMLYTVGWTIPEDYATGTLDYDIIATVDGEEYSYKPFEVEPSKLTIIEGTEDGEQSNG